MPIDPNTGQNMTWNGTSWSGYSPISPQAGVAAAPVSAPTAPTATPPPAPGPSTFSPDPSYQAPTPGLGYGTPPWLQQQTPGNMQSGQNPLLNYGSQTPAPTPAPSTGQTNPGNGWGLMPGQHQWGQQRQPGMGMGGGFMQFMPHGTMPAMGTALGGTPQSGQPQGL